MSILSMRERLLRGGGPDELNSQVFTQGRNRWMDEIPSGPLMPKICFLFAESWARNVSVVKTCLCEVMRKLSWMPSIRRPSLTFRTANSSKMTRLIKTNAAWEELNNMSTGWPYTLVLVLIYWHKNQTKRPINSVMYRLYPVFIHGAAVLEWKSGQLELLPKFWPKNSTSGNVSVDIVSWELRIDPVKKKTFQEIERN